MHGLMKYSVWLDGTEGMDDGLLFAMSNSQRWMLTGYVISGFKRIRDVAQLKRT